MIGMPVLCMRACRRVVRPGGFLIFLYLYHFLHKSVQLIQQICVIFAFCTFLCDHEAEIYRRLES